LTPLEEEEIHLAWEEYDRYQKAEKHWKEHGEGPFDVEGYRLKRLAEIE